MVALDKTTRENGCLQIATGSHKLGRIDHTPLSPTQNEVDPKRMPYILEQCPIEYCELAAGDALIFHCNAIHRSDANRSANRRWTLLICYNRVDNDTIVKSDDRYFVPLDKVDDGALAAPACASPAATTRSTSRRGPTCRICARRLSLRTARPPVPHHCLITMIGPWRPRPPELSAQPLRQRRDQAGPGLFGLGAALALLLDDFLGRARHEVGVAELGVDLADLVGTAS